MREEREREKKITMSRFEITINEFSFFSLSFYFLRLRIFPMAFTKNKIRTFRRCC